MQQIIQIPIFGSSGRKSKYQIITMTPKLLSVVTVPFSLVLIACA
jgi:hypothetical protein